MYLRTTQRRNRDGSSVRYLQLAHNQWDAKAGRSSVQVLYHFGREDQLDRDAIRRLISSLSRALPPDQALAVQAPELLFLDSRPLGGAGSSTSSGDDSAWTRSWPDCSAAAASTRWPNERCSPWSATGPSNPSPSSAARNG